ncbi:uncharacterized protein MYCFIDRAFT_81462, partial [Pseudocercospora fijiensis CIRAD86]
MIVVDSSKHRMRHSVLYRAKWLVSAANMDGSQQISIMLPFGICFGLLAGTIASLVFVIGLVVGGLSTAMYLVRFKNWMGTKPGPKDERNKKSKKGSNDAIDSPPIPLPPATTNGHEPNPPSSPFRPWARPVLRETDDGSGLKPYPNMCGTTLRPPSPRLYGDPFAGMGLPRPRPKKKKKQEGCTWFPDDPEPATGDAGIPKTPDENEMFDPFYNLGRGPTFKPRGPLGATKFADVETYPPPSDGIKHFTERPPLSAPPPPQPKDSFMHNPFADMKPPPAASPISDILDTFDFDALDKMDRKKSIQVLKAVYMNCIPTMTGGIGREDKHTRVVDWILPGVQPTNKVVHVAMVSIVT